ncbi:tol-pal system protein YbgF [Amphritea sp. 1_MG-2023]|uniref:tol-pal system protein YbgF n=1 Tax=Amphritea sp. 1_MG-2023 TaxID=3062670 RepID=UPI0026E452DB|nr:tol-pal system protein YbgF [Amphritea sp. 1_MG-2023]MDO6562565.1 tol-pal system protein YbgF [Amphritea sp. 1_MG-2023]
MRKAYHSAAALMLLSASVIAADPVQVIELQLDEGTNRSTINSGAMQYRGGNTDTAMMLQQLQDEVRSLRGMVEQQQYQLRQMEQQQRDRYRDLDRRISAGTASSTTLSTGQPASTSASVALPAADSTPSDAQAYQQAFGLVRNKDFTAALEAFDQFITLYPDSPRLPNAYYWVGEVNLAEQKLAPAKVAFEEVLNTFPQHRKAADASYKLGVIYHQMGEQASATEMFNNTISGYPDSSAANLARDYLKR